MSRPLEFGYELLRKTSHLAGCIEILSVLAGTYQDHKV
jgi:hypothetical protein